MSYNKKLDPKKILELASLSLVEEEIASVLGVCVETLKSKPAYREALEKGKNTCKSSLRRKQYTLAMDGNVRMLEVLGKSLLGQRDKMELSGDKSAPLKISVNIIGSQEFEDLEDE